MLLLASARQELGPGNCYHACATAGSCYFTLCCGCACVLQVKAFAAAAVGPPVAGYPCPPYKLLILDEADSMTQVSTQTDLESKQAVCLTGQGHAQLLTVGFEGG